MVSLWLNLVKSMRCALYGGLAPKCLSASLVNGFNPATPVVVDVYNVGQRLHIIYVDQTNQLEDL